MEKSVVSAISCAQNVCYEIAISVSSRANLVDVSMWVLKSTKPSFAARIHPYKMGLDRS